MIGRDDVLLFWEKSERVKKLVKNYNVWSEDCCRLCSGLRDGTETSSTLRRWSSARHAVVPSELAFRRFLYSVQDCGTLCLDLCDTSHNTTSYIVWRHFSLRVLVYTVHQGLWQLCAIQICVLLKLGGAPSGNVTWIAICRYCRSLISYYVSVV